MLLNALTAAEAHFDLGQGTFTLSDQPSNSFYCFLAMLDTMLQMHTDTVLIICKIPQFPCVMLLPVPLSPCSQHQTQRYGCR